MKMKELMKSVGKESTDQELRLKQTKVTVLFYIFMTLMMAFSFISLVIAMNNVNSPIIILSFLVFFITLLFVAIFKIYNLKPLTVKGRELFDYLKGLKMYIKLAEAERLKVLQSPEGAERKPVDTNDGANMIVLYERVLPYAVLFGQEKEWLKRLGMYYENNQVTPGWYNGINGFNTASFVSSVSSFSSYASSSSFSSSSGAGGGGFSGGGGGGGGGGGR